MREDDNNLSASYIWLGYCVDVTHPNFTSGQGAIDLEDMAVRHRHRLRNVPELQMAAVLMHLSQDSNKFSNIEEREREIHRCALVKRGTNGQLTTRTLVVSNCLKQPWTDLRRGNAGNHVS